MQSFYQSFVKPLLFKLDPEFAHEITVDAGLIAAKSILNQLIFSPFSMGKFEQVGFDWNGLHFQNRIGLAAGFDKNARLMALSQKLGFGFQEIGSVTANASNGNSKPRLFRLPQDEAIINRMGLNNDGVDEIAERLFGFQHDYPLGINIAKTHSPRIIGEAAIHDYVYSFKKVEPIADYITLNISCPNTEEGKTFEEPEALSPLLKAIYDARVTNKPILVKLSVDLEKSALKELVSLCKEFGVDGFVCSNTSSKRYNLETSLQEIQTIGKGGLSGKPIFGASVERVSWVRELAPNALIIGVGGIFSGDDALEYIKNGANLVQVYSGLIYKGPSLIKEINTSFRSFFSTI